jgi:hypothetical protein
MAFVALSHGNASLNKFENVVLKEKNRIRLGAVFLLV